MINPPGLTFDEATHVYRYDGKIVPGVTSILKPMVNFDRVDPRVLAAKADLGTRVHFACQLHNEDDLDEDTVEPEVMGYLQAYRKFLLESGANVLLSEVRVYHPLMRYAGTIDLVLGYAQQKWTVDIKTAITTPITTGVQTAAYTAALEDPAITGRAALRLRPDGTYRFDQLSNPNDLAVFTAALTIHRFLESKK